MSGTYGHESAKRQDVGHHLRAILEAAHYRFNQSGRVVADGYSCRSQVKRQDGRTVLHPLQVLLQTLRR